MALKIILFLIGTLFCIAFAAIPEAAAYGIWHMVQPTDEWGKIALIAVLGLAGGGITIVVWIFSFAMWVSGVAVLIK